MRLRHPQRLNFGQFLLSRHVGHHVAQPLKRIIQAVHAFPFAGVGRLAALLENQRRRRTQVLFAAALFPHHQAAVIAVVAVSGITAARLGS